MSSSLLLSKPFFRWSLLATVSIGLFMVALDVTILYTALPILTRELHASTVQGLWIVNAYPLVTAGLLLGAGTLGDRIGHRRMYMAGLAIFGLASLFAAYSLSPAWLVLGRIFQAVGAAAMMPSTLALIRLVFVQERERNVAISIWASVSLLGAIAGPLVGGILLQHYAWGAIFLINVPIVFLALLSTHYLAPRSFSTAPAQPWDWQSSVLGLLALTGLVALIKALAAGEPNWLHILTLSFTTLVSAMAFAYRQSRLSTPLVDFSLFRQASFTSGVVAAALVTFATGGILLSLTQRFQWVEGFTPLQAGSLVSVIFLGALPSGLLGGVCLHRVGLRALMAGGLALASLGIALCAWWEGSSLSGLVMALLIAGVGLGATISVASTAIIGSAPAHRAGMAASLEEVAYEFGSLLAVAVLGSLLGSFYSAALQLPPGTADIAREGWAEALELAAHTADGSGDVLRTAVLHAFDTGFRRVLYLMSGLLLFASLVIAYLLRDERPLASRMVKSAG